MYTVPQKSQFKDPLTSTCQVTLLSKERISTGRIQILLNEKLKKLKWEWSKNLDLNPTCD